MTYDEKCQSKPPDDATDEERANREKAMAAVMAELQAAAAAMDEKMKADLAAALHQGRLEGLAGAVINYMKEPYRWTAYSASQYRIARLFDACDWTEAARIVGEMEAKT